MTGVERRAGNGICADAGWIVVGCAGEQPGPSDLKILPCELIESGTVTPIIDRTYSLDQTSDAIRYIEVELLTQWTDMARPGRCMYRR
jgi:hypothetical protein